MAFGPGCITASGFSTTFLLSAVSSRTKRMAMSIVGCGHNPAGIAMQQNFLRPPLSDAFLKHVNFCYQ